MKILLASNASYMPTRGGAARCNRSWLEYLSARGHECSVLSPKVDVSSAQKQKRLRAELNTESSSFVWMNNTHDSASVNGVNIHFVADTGQMPGVLGQVVKASDPDLILISSEDCGQRLLSCALTTSSQKVIYLAHTPQILPFGPHSLCRSSSGWRAISNVRAIITVSRYIQEYISVHGKQHAVAIHPPVYGSMPFADYGSNQAGYITVINPCSVKGITIFRALIDRNPHMKFAFLSGWGTTEQDARCLQDLGAEELPPCTYIDQVLSQTQVLIVPSLWPEGFGLVVVEAMLRGIPVLASNAGGLPEAKLGTRYVLPVRLIEDYGNSLDDQGLPKVNIPEQNYQQWSDALNELLNNPAIYWDASREAREVSTEFHSNISAETFEHFLESCVA